MAKTMKKQKIAKEAHNVTIVTLEITKVTTVTGSERITAYENHTVCAPVTVGRVNEMANYCK